MFEASLLRTRLLLLPFVKLRLTKRFDMKSDAGNSSSMGASFVDISVLSIGAILILKSFFFSLLFERVRRKEKK